MSDGANTVIVTGGRDINSFMEWMVFRELDAAKPDRVVQGGAHGADSVAIQWCREHAVECVTVKPDYQRYGGLHAPRERNVRMLDMFPDAVVLAFPTIQSRGTWHCVREAKRRGMVVSIFRC